MALLSSPPVGATTPSQQAPEGRAPVFHEGASTTRRLAENSDGGRALRPPVSATAADGHRLTYRLGGTDAEFFALDSRNGQLRTRDGVDYDREVRDRYAVTVQAEDGRGNSSAIAVVITVTNEIEPPSPPNAPTATASTRDTLTVRWTAPTNDGPAIRDYEGRYGVAGDGTIEGGWSRVGAITETTIERLTADTLYEVQVRARNAEGISDWSASLEARTEPNREPVFREGAETARLLKENTAAGVDVGTPVAATDPDGDRLVYGLEGPDGSSFSIDSDTGQLSTRVGVTYDHETRPELTATVKVEDGHSGSATATVTVSVTAAEATPTADAGWDLTLAAGGTAWLDGTASSTAVGTLSYSWSFVSWPGSTTPSLESPTGATPSFTAAAEGTYVVRLTVGNGTATATDDVRVSARPSTDADLLVVADLLVDTNRDGLVNRSDEAGEATWTEAAGAVFASNADDDDEDGARDGWDVRINGDADLLDMAPVVVRQIPGLHRNHAVVLEMEPASTSVGPQLFHRAANGDVELLIGGNSRRAELPLEQLVAGDLRVYLDSRYGRWTGFDGHLSLTLTVSEGGTKTSQDTVALRGGPILFSHHLQPAQRVFVLEIPTLTTSHNTALLNALSAHLPASVALHRLDYVTYLDSWLQDSMQTGYAQRAAEDGVETPAVHTQLHRGRGLEPFLSREYLGPEAGYVYPGGAWYSSLNYGGNVEVIPPHTHDDATYSFGRIVIGEPLSSGWHPPMAPAQIDFFNSQGVQGPPLAVDTSWLVVGHVDEIFSVLPNRDAGTGERPWVVAIGSPALAIDLLEEVVEKGFGDAPIFEGRGEDETTAREMLADRRLMTVNDQAQAKIDTVRDKLIAEVGLAETDFREVPALFDPIHVSEHQLGLVALVPSMQNLLVVDDLLLVPDPEGPDVDGTDVWRQGFLDAVEGLGLTTHFVDIYNSYHTLWGGIHCGTNVERAGSTTPWWGGTEGEDAR